MRNEQHRVKPGLSTKSTELYRRIQNGTFDPAVFGKDAYLMGVEADRLKKLSKPALMDEMVKGQEKIVNLKKKLNERPA